MESFHAFYLHTKLIHKNLERCDTALLCEKTNIAKEEQYEEPEYLQPTNDDDDNLNIANACKYLLIIGNKNISF